MKLQLWSMPKAKASSELTNEAFNRYS